ncbi:MAG TPA: hypothetical protein VJ890_21665 [Vineibacter sp.]|nr:hypothetical protein [Vineibacter sp.]
MRRKLDQGRGRPIISTVFKDHRVVAVGSRVFFSKQWKTFPDFLIYYIKTVMGGDWGNSELAKDASVRHPLVNWYQMLCAQQQATITTPGEIATARPTGASWAYLNLAYNLYLLAHNVQVQSRLIERLKDPEQFYGAYYETFVARHFIEAGFTLEPEDETDGTTTHCEFTATQTETGKKFSVEAKCRYVGNTDAERKRAKYRIGRHLFGALGKRAAYPRIVFIDAGTQNMVDEHTADRWARAATHGLRRLESTLLKGAELPPAYVFLTYDSALENLTSTNLVRAVVAEGFRIADFRRDVGFPSIRDAVASRERHAPMHALMKSIGERNWQIPQSFDGKFPELMNQDEAERLIVGHVYDVAGDGEPPRMARLVTGTVMPEKKLAWTVMTMLDGSGNAIYTFPLSDNEIAAYRRQPDTFFGVVQSQGKQAKDGLDMFDFFWECYSNTPTEKLLEFLANHPRIAELRTADRKEILTTFCEGYANSAVAMAEKRKAQSPIGGPAKTVGTGQADDHEAGPTPT